LQPDRYTPAYANGDDSEGFSRGSSHPELAKILPAILACHYPDEPIALID